MNLNDVNFEKIEKKLPEKTKQILFEAMDIYDAMLRNPVDFIEDYINNDKKYLLVTVAYYLAILKVDTPLKKLLAETNKLTYEKILRPFEIGREDIHPLDRNKYKEHYEDGFKIIIYNTFLAVRGMGAGRRLKDVSYEFLAYHIHEDYIAYPQLIKKIINRLYRDDDYFSKSWLISSNLVNDIMGIDCETDDDYDYEGFNSELGSKKDKVIQANFKINHVDSENIEISKTGMGKLIKLKKD